MAIKPQRSKVSKTPRRGHEPLVVSIARLEEQAEQNDDRFEQLGNALERILTRVEELALSTTSLNTRHDTEIQVLQKQIASTETTLQQTRDDIHDLSSRMVELIKTELARGIAPMSESITALSAKMETQHASLEKRVQRLENWRMFLIGAGLAIGFFMSRFFDNLFTYLFRN